MMTILALAALAQDLQWKLAAGEDLTYEHAVEQSLKLTQDGSTFDYAQKLEFTERVTVERATLDGNFELRATTVRLRVSIDGKLMFDSDAPAKSDPRLARAFDGVGRTYTLVVTPGGKPAGRRGLTVQERLQRTLGGAAEEGEPEIPMALVALALPSGSERAWTSTEEEERGPARLVSTASYRAEGGVVRGDIELKLDKAPATMKLREGAGRQRAVFDGVLKESDYDFALAVENTIDGKPVRVSTSVKSSTKLKERTRR